ncbi:unnamed protein product, partial [Adineta ricciae]
MTRFDFLPNELIFIIFDHLNPIDILYSFFNLNQRINEFLKVYLKSKIHRINLIKLHGNVFQYYSLQKQLIKQLKSIELTDEQMKFMNLSSNTHLKYLNLYLKNSFHISLNEQIIFKNLQILFIRNQSLTFEKPFIQCSSLKKIFIHLKTHSDVIDLLNSLPIIEICHVNINYEVTNSDENCSNKLLNLSTRLNDFSYEINSYHGLVYFVTKYERIEMLIKQMKSLEKLRLYVIGCFNTIMNYQRLNDNIFNHLFKLKEFHLFFQTYTGELFNDFQHSKWNFASYWNSLTDMHYLFTLPYQFHRLDQCIDQNFFTSIQTNLSHSNLNLLPIKFVRHLDLSCHITIEFIDLLRKSFSSLKSIRFSSSTAEYLHPPPLFRQHRYFLHSVRKLEFDLTCRNQILFLCLLPNLAELILHQ